MAQRAVIQTKRAPMFDDAVAAKVAEHIAFLSTQPFTVADAEALIEKHCGRYSRGKHAGKLRGWAEISMVVEGGWKKDGPGYMNGHVERPGRITKVRIVDNFAGRVYLEIF